MNKPDLNEKPAACPPLADTTGSGRESEIESLLREIMEMHANPYAPEWNQCDTSPCNWCERAAKIVGPNTQVER